MLVDSWTASREGFAGSGLSDGGRNLGRSRGEVKRGSGPDATLSRRARWGHRDGDGSGAQSANSGARMPGRVGGGRQGRGSLARSRQRPGGECWLEETGAGRRRGVGELAGVAPRGAGMVCGFQKRGAEGAGIQGGRKSVRTWRGVADLAGWDCESKSSRTPGDRHETA